MNKVILMGRLTRDPEVRYSSGANSTAVCHYGLAVDRSYKRDNEDNVDFINIVAFGNRAEFAGKYFKKGMMVAVVGELRINSYTDRDGNKRTGAEVVVSEQYFAESKASFEARSGGSYNGSNGGSSRSSSNYSSDFAPASAQNRPAPSRANQGQDSNGQDQPQAEADNSPDGFTPIDKEIEGDDDLPF